MAQAREPKEPTRDEALARHAPGDGTKPFPPGEGPVEYRPKKGLHLAKAGRVVKEAWVGRLCGRSVRVYRGAPEGALPAQVKAALEESGIEIGIITLEELGLRPRETGIVNLSQQS